MSHDNFTTFMGLPVSYFIPVGLHCVESMTVFGTTYMPCYIQVEEAENGNTQIVGWGMQPHLMQHTSEWREKLAAKD